ALGALKRRGVPFRAVVAGGGPMEDSLRGMARAEGVDEWTRFEGFVDETRLRSLYRDADLYVSLSRSDSTSQSLLEAMAAELVRAGSDIEGTREWVTHRREGYLAPLGAGDAVACALAEAARAPEARHMAERARAQVLARGRFIETLDHLEQRLRRLAS